MKIFVREESINPFITTMFLMGTLGNPKKNLLIPQFLLQHQCRLDADGEKVAKAILSVSCEELGIAGPLTFVDLTIHRYLKD